MTGGRIRESVVSPFPLPRLSRVIVRPNVSEHSCNSPKLAVTHRSLHEYGKCHAFAMRLPLRLPCICHRKGSHFKCEGFPVLGHGSGAEC